MNITPESPAIHVAELQKIMAEGFALNNGNWDPLKGQSSFDDKPFGTGQDGDWGSTCTANVKAMQEALFLPVNGQLVDDYLWHVITVRRYGSGSKAVDLSDYYTREQTNDLFVNTNEIVRIAKVTGQ